MMLVFPTSAQEIYTGFAQEDDLGVLLHAQQLYIPTTKNEDHPQRRNKITGPSLVHTRQTIDETMVLKIK